MRTWTGLTALGERRMMARLSAVMDNAFHPIHDCQSPGKHEWQASSPMLCERAVPQVLSFPSAVRLYDQACSHETKHVYGSSSTSHVQFTLFTSNPALFISWTPYSYLCLYLHCLFVNIFTFFFHHVIISISYFLITTWHVLSGTSGQ